MVGGNVVVPDDTPVEVWTCPGKLVLTQKNEVYVQSCGNYMSDDATKNEDMGKSCWSNVKQREGTISECQYCFMPRNSTTYPVFALRVLTEVQGKSEGVVCLCGCRESMIGQGGSHEWQRGMRR